ncbi:GNAT family N-acetyltransferase [Streptomyces hundungensis]|uniref:GNAT family N-acetyltransferase n=1 Tax=Streptomyces hundungensis TaxID=1077946 RepID=UPI0033D086F6
MDLPRQVMDVDATLTLRAFEGEADLPELFRVVEESLEHLRPWLPWVGEHSLARTTRFLARRAELWASGDEYTYAIVLDGDIVGACGLFRRDATRDEAREIGYWLHPSATGRGAATRAAGPSPSRRSCCPGSSGWRSCTTRPTWRAAPSRPASASPRTNVAPSSPSLRWRPARTRCGG